MKKYLLIVVIALFGLSCSQQKTGNENRSFKKDTVARIMRKSAALNPDKVVESDTSNADYPGWVDTLVTSYMKQTSNELVRYSMTHHLKEEWVVDDRKKTDTATYWIFNIGHDVS